MIQKNKFHLLIIIFLLSFASCKATEITTTRVEKLSFSTSAKNELILHHSNGSKQILLSEGNGYNTHVSPNKEYIAVDLTKFSNLQITKLFKRQSDRQYRETKNLSSIAWKNYCENNNIQIEDISNPRSRVVRLSNDEVVMELSGMSEKQKSIFEGLKIKLK